jgi:hypothetical protein
MTSIVGDVGARRALRWRILYWERPKRALAIPFGIGFATGPSVGRMPVGDVGISGRRQTQSFERVDWLQLDVAFELQQKSGFHLVVAGGVASPIGYWGQSCTVTESDATSICYAQPELIETLTVMFGYAL